MTTEIEIFEPIFPENEDYFTSRMMTKVAKLYGERGELAVGTYTYFRWVDDTVDVSTYPRDEKLEFLNRQKSLIKGILPDNPHPMETAFTELPWVIVGEKREKLDSLALDLVDTIEDDAKHTGSYPRTYEELKEYNIKTFLTSMEALSLMFNDESLEPDNGFKEFLNNWYIVGSLKDFREDIERHQLQVGFTPEEVEHLNELPTPEERRMEVLYIYDEDRFGNEKESNLRKLKKRKGEFFNLNMPLWQKTLCFSYMQRACLKTQIGVKYPPQEVIAGLKREGLKVKTKGLIKQNKKEPPTIY